MNQQENRCVLYLDLEDTFVSIRLIFLSLHCDIGTDDVILTDDIIDDVTIVEGEETTPENPAIKKSLDAMLTPYLARKLHNSSPQEVISFSAKFISTCLILVCDSISLQLLKLLNSNAENPNLIWDNGTRGEIMKFLEEEQERKITTVSMYMCH